MARLKAREDEKNDAAKTTVAKKEDQKKKKSRVAIAHVLLGSELLEKKKQGALAILRSLKIDELHALLINASPQDSMPRPNNKVGYCEYAIT